MDNQFIKTINLIGEDAFKSIQNKKILLAGLGGVGGTTFEALVRIGFTKFIIVDKDIVSLSNLNRQILYVMSDLDKAKVDVAISRALSINPQVEITKYYSDVKDISIDNVDMIVDCVDDIEAKIHLIEMANKSNTPIIISTGMANKIDPSRIKVSLLNKTTVDPLAKKLRYELKKRNIDFSSLYAVYSDELPNKDGSNLNSLLTVTSVAGLYIANHILNVLK